MPKTNDNSGATYAGYEGIVEHAGGAGSTRPGGLSQVHPSLELDGSVVEGYDGPDLDDVPREVIIPAAPQALTRNTRSAMRPVTRSRRVMLRPWRRRSAPAVLTTLLADVEGGMSWRGVNC